MARKTKTKQKQYDPSQATEEERARRFIWEPGDFDLLTRDQVSEVLGNSPAVKGGSGDSGGAGGGNGGGQGA